MGEKSKDRGNFYVAYKSTERRFTTFYGRVRKAGEGCGNFWLY
jgi:hypothetical protein